MSRVQFMHAACWYTTVVAAPEAEHLAVAFGGAGSVAVALHARYRRTGAAAGLGARSLRTLSAHAVVICAH